MDRQQPDVEPERVIEVDNLTRDASDGAQSIAGLTFHINAGEVYCLLGLPGTGKTSALSVIAGFQRATGGRATVLGGNIWDDRLTIRRQLTYIDGRADAHGLYESLSPVRNLEFFRSLRSPKPLPRDRIFNALRRMNVPERSFDRAIADLPRSASLATALALAHLHESSVLVLDEPTAGLDSRATADFEECVAEFRRARTTVLLATADVLVAGQIADRIAILANGRIATERGRREILGQSLAELYMTYVGRPAPHGLPPAMPISTPPTRPR